MARKRKTLPKEMAALLERGEIEAAKQLFSRCEPNAVLHKNGSNLFSLAPLPREFAFWARQQGADVNFRDAQERTPIFIHASLWNGDARLLIDLGADAAAAMYDGVTPLHLAALYGRAEAAKALLQAGADPNAPSGRIDWPGFLTPLEKAIQQDRLRYEKLLEICGILLDHGAEVTDRARQYLQKSAEEFQRRKGEIQDQAYLSSQAENLDKLYKLLETGCFR